MEGKREYSQIRKQCAQHAMPGACGINGINAILIALQMWIDMCAHLRHSRLISRTLHAKCTIFVNV